MKKVVALLMASAIAVPAVASANSGFYVGSFIGNTQAKNTEAMSENVGHIPADQTIKGNFKSFGLKAGYDFNSYFGAEIRHVRNSGSEEKGGQTLTPQSQTGLYGKAMLPITESFHLYGLAGINSAKLKNVGFKDNDTKSTINSFSYGMGAQYNFTPALGANVELIKLSSHKHFDAHAVNLGMSYKF